MIRMKSEYFDKAIKNAFKVCYHSCMIEEDYSFACPYCGVPLSVRLDVSGGGSQQFVQDCEVCCRPIQIAVRFDGDSIVDFKANPEDG